MVVPAGGGLVAPAAGGPAQGEGEAGAGDQPGGCLRGQAVQPGGLGGGQPDGDDAGLPAVGWHGRVTEGNRQVSVVHVVAVVWTGAFAGGSGACGRELDAAVQAVADGGVAELGHGGQGGMPADPVPEPDLGLVPAEDVFSRFERFLNCRGLAVAIRAQSLNRGPLVPVPHEGASL